MDLLTQTKEFIATHELIKPTRAWTQDPDIDSWKFYEWIILRSQLPWIKLHGIDIPHAAMLQEAKNLRDRFVNHREGNGVGWLSLCIHGLSADKTKSASMYGYDDYTAPYVWTDIADLCPVTVDFFKNHFKYKKYLRIRFMLLEPQGFIEPHSDSSDHVLGPVNISLNNPENCKLVNEQGLVPLEPGSAVLFNTSYRHGAFNNSQEDRYHIIVHGTPEGQFWKDIVIDSFKRQYT
jgi:Aspartyl/Asparaginyl beta-hydroxylase